MLGIRVVGENGYIIQPCGIHDPPHSIILDIDLFWKTLDVVEYPRQGIDFRIMSKITIKKMIVHMEMKLRTKTRNNLCDALEEELLNMCKELDWEEEDVKDHKKIARTANLEWGIYVRDYLEEVRHNKNIGILQ